MSEKPITHHSLLVNDRLLHSNYKRGSMTKITTQMIDFPINAHSIPGYLAQP